MRFLTVMHSGSFLPALLGAIMCSGADAGEISRPCLKAMSIVVHYFLPQGWDLPDDHPKRHTHFSGLSCVQEGERIVVRYEIIAREGSALGFYQSGRDVTIFDPEDWSVVASYDPQRRPRVPGVSFKPEVFDLRVGEHLDPGCLKALRALEFRFFSYRWFERSLVDEFSCQVDDASQIARVSYRWREATTVSKLFNVSTETAIWTDDADLRD